MKEKETYTPGHSKIASGFMALRDANTNAKFFTPHLEPNMRLLDCGCGPGSITCGLARQLLKGSVTGVDSELSQVELAVERARKSEIENVEFSVASAYRLPFPDASFDAVFSHALFEHLSEPTSALAEFYRVLVPGGLIGVRSPDWGGFLVTPTNPGVEAAIAFYAGMQTANGGDIHVGRKLPALARSTGFVKIDFSATYDCGQSPQVIGEYFADGLMAMGANEEADAILEWGRDANALWATSWCETIGYK